MTMSRQSDAEYAAVRRGENAPRAKLTADNVREIRKLLEAGESCPKIGRRFGVAASTINSIHAGNSWRSVE